MNNQTIKFTSVTIQNFRGIPTELTVPLNAPLTIIHAANGTGKSSIGYALEWLLTGKVEDLPKVTDFSCEWGVGDSYVSAICMIDDRECELKRKGKSILLKEGDGKCSRISQNDLLAILTPTSIGGRSSQATAKAKRSWLRNSRWLYSNSLSFLVDNSKAEDRQQIFADILGFGHLTKNLRELRDYRKQLPSLKGLNDKIADLSQQIKEHEERVLTNTPLKQLAEKNITKIFEELPTAAQTGKLKEDFELAQYQINVFEQQVQSKVSTLRFLSEQLNNYKAEETQSKNLNQTKEKLVQANEEFTKKLTDLSSQRSSCEAKAAEALRAINWAVQCNEKLNLWEKVIIEQSIELCLLEGRTTERRLNSDFVEFSWSKDKQNEWLSAIDYLQQKFSTITSLVDQKTALLSNEVHPPVDFEKMTLRLEEAKVAKIKAESEFNTLSGLNDKLKALGLEIASSNSGRLCPLCEHNWGSNENLRNQIKKEAFSTPILMETAKKLEIKTQREQEAANLVALGAKQKREYDAYITQLEAVNNQLASIEEKTSFLQTMNFQDFSSCTEINLEYLKRRILAAIHLGEIFNVIEQVESLFKEAPAELLCQRIEKATNNLDKYQNHYDSQQRVTNSELINLNRELEKVSAQISINIREVDDLKSTIDALSTSKSQFESKWKSIMKNDQVISVSELKKGQGKVKEKQSQLTLLKSQLDECSAINKIDFDPEVLNRLRADKKELSDKLRIGTDHIDLAEKTIESFSNHINELTYNSLAPLLEPAGELFSRMHANEVYKSLGISGSEELTWTVQADGDKFALDAEEKLSQGQRQDLALSLYLARARNTGGSFFLDEPIAHLDDLNRVAMLDILRLFASSIDNSNLILTTASDSLARHISQKFSSIKNRHLVNMIHLEGNPRSGISMSISSNAISQ